MTRRAGIVAGLLAALSLILAGTALAQSNYKPRSIAWTAYNVGSTGYIQSAAIGDALGTAEGVTMRVVPAGNDIARMAPLRTRQVQFSAMGSGSYLAQEGVLDFAQPDWGPQPVRLLLMSWADTNTGNVCTAEDAGIRKMSDLRGKRVSWVLGAPALNNNMTAFLAFGGLTWDDVEKVEFPGFKQAMQGIVDNVTDASIASTDSGFAYQVESSPRGVFWPETPKSDTEGWKRLKAVAPYFAPHVAIAGAGISPQKPHHGASYGYPILITYPWVEDKLVYYMVEQMDKLYPKYKDSHPGSVGWALDRQVFDWAIPYHTSAIEYFKQKGVWTDEFQAGNDRLMKRQEVLADAWRKAKDSFKGGDGWQAHWMAVRARELKAAGFEPVWEK